MPWADSLQLAPFTLVGAVGMSLLPYAPSHPHSHPVTSFFPSTAVLRRGGHNLGRQRHNHSIPVGGQLTWAPASWFLLSVHSLLCHSSLTRMQLALSFHMSQRERGGLFFWFINITKYGSCDTLFKVGQMQDRASVLEELARPSYQQHVLKNYFHILGKKNKESMNSSNMPVSPINLPATNTRMQLSRKRWHLIFRQSYGRQHQRRNKAESHQSIFPTAVKVEWLISTTFMLMFWQNLIY